MYLLIKHGDFPASYVSFRGGNSFKSPGWSQKHEADQRILIQSIVLGSAPFSSVK